jgi:serine/threonine-protein kinase
MKTCPVCDTDYPDQHATCPADGAVLIGSHELAPGHLVRGKYRIVRKLGQGGMGVVYLAEDILLGVQVALKFLVGELGKDPKFIRRFRLEARAAYQLRHPNIVEVTNLDQGEDGSLFIAMEFIEGPSLRAALQEARGGFEVQRALEITRGILSGLALAHKNGTVHRDIKPENILLTRPAQGVEKPKVLDFGIVAIAESVTQSSLTRGMLLTPSYAAPEQWEEMPAAEMEGRTDLYALGCVFYEMLTGQTPFHAHNTSGWMMAHLEGTPQPPSLLRPELANWNGLDALVLRMLAKKRDDRPQDAEAIRLLDAVQYGPGEQRHETMHEERWERSETVFERSGTRQEPATAPLPAPTVPAHKQSWWGWAALGASVLLAAFTVYQFAWPKHNEQVAQPQTTPATAPPVAQQQSVQGPANPPPSQSQANAPVPKIPVPGPPSNSKSSGNESNSVTPKQDPAEIARQALALYGQKRYSEASPLLDQACTSGSWESCKELGNLYRDGNGVAMDESRAVALFSKACAGGLASACDRLGYMYGSGRGVAKDDSQAVTLYTKACDAGDALGCSNLGVMYRDGIGMAKDDSRAAALFLKACEAGDAPGCSDLGGFYRLGRGVEKDPEKARQFFSKGCQMGNQWGCDRLKEMH